MKVAVIARNTFKEAVRNKILYMLLVFALILIMSSIILSLLAVGSAARIIIHLGLFSILFFGVLISIFVGIGLVYNEIDKKTIFTIISKPIHRYEFIIGKYLGLMLTIFVNVAIMSIFFLLLLVIYKSQLEQLGATYSEIIQAICLSFVELAIITAAVTLFSSFSTPILSAILTFMVFIIGHSMDDFQRWGIQLIDKGTAVFAGKFFIFLSYILPRFDRLESRKYVFDELYLNAQNDVVAPSVMMVPKYFVLSIGYGMFYAAFLLFIAVLAFRKRNFT